MPSALHSRVIEITCPYKCCGKMTGRSKPLGTNVFAEGPGEWIICEACGNAIVVVLYSHQQRPRNPPLARRRDPEPPPRK